MTMPGYGSLTVGDGTTASPLTLASQVDLGVPVFFRHFDRPAMRRAAHIVDQHVDAAKAFDAGGHHGGDCGIVGDVAWMGDDLAACGFHPLDRLGGAVEIAVDRENLGAFLGKPDGGGAAVAPAGSDAAGAGDDGNASLQASAHDPPPVAHRLAGAVLAYRFSVCHQTSSPPPVPPCALSVRSIYSQPPSRWSRPSPFPALVPAELDRSDRIGVGHFCARRLGFWLSSPSRPPER